ncbi:MAG: hypothetical protein LBF12_02645 [Christensenellaceae bacterium]|jgi:hypothetical protein|nr:hypothetical protein [Christensenellaceae bacterium]
MKKSKGMVLVKLLAYLIGFPAIMAYAVYQSMTVISDSATGTDNTSYFPYVYAGLLIVALMWLLYLIVALITGMITKRRKTARSAYVGTAVLVVFSFLLTSGVWFAIDKYVPPILSDATQSTIYYSDLEEDWAERAHTHSELLAGFIEMNIENGRLSGDPDIYLSEKFANKEVKDLIKNSYNSINDDAYNNFNGPLINLANGGRLTIPVLIHLLLDDRADPYQPFNNYTGEGRGEENKNAPIKWAILDMQQEIMGVELNLIDLLGDLATNKAITEALTNILNGESLQGTINALNGAIASDEILGAPIYVSLIYDAASSTILIELIPSSERRGVYDYMRMAWFDSNYLLVAVISLFPIRNTFYIFSLLLCISSLILGIARKRQYAGSGKALKATFSHAKEIPMPSHGGYGRIEYNPHAVNDQYSKIYQDSVDNYNYQNR